MFFTIRSHRVIFVCIIYKQKLQQPDAFWLFKKKKAGLPSKSPERTPWLCYCPGSKSTSKSFLVGNLVAEGRKQVEVTKMNSQMDLRLWMYLHYSCYTPRGPMNTGLIVSCLHCQCGVYQTTLSGRFSMSNQRPLVGERDQCRKEQLKQISVISPIECTFSLFSSLHAKPFIRHVLHW